MSTDPRPLSAEEIAIAAVLSVYDGKSLAWQAMEAAPGAIAHLRAQGFDVVSLDALTARHAELVAALEIISDGRHPDGHRGAVLVARAALDGEPR